MRTFVLAQVANPDTGGAVLAAAANGGGRAIMLIICAIAAVVVVRSMRILWQLIAEVLRMMLHVGVAALLALTILLAIVLIMTGYI